MNSESPFSGSMPDGGGDDAPYEWLDEWLCEYVDGTMDPSLEAVFEQYVEANPDLKAHVQRLKQTRDLLCECGLPREPGPDFESEICSDVPCESAPAPQPGAGPSSRLLSSAGFVSSVAVALVVGFLVGAAVTAPGPLPFATSADTDALRIRSVRTMPTAAPSPTPSYLSPRSSPSPSPTDSSVSLQRINLP